jgi:phage terminase small subunit
MKLSKEASDLREKLIRTYEIQAHDSRRVLLVDVVVETFERLKQAQRAIAREGLTVTDRFKQIKPHPLLECEEHARMALIKALASLKLPDNPIPTDDWLERALTEERPPGRTHEELRTDLKEVFR